MWILRSHRCCGALFIEQSKLVFLTYAQRFTLQKGFIKYGKINGITPMRTHLESTHPKLVACKKLAIIEELVVASHNQQFRKQSFRPFGCVITSYFGATNPYKKCNEAQQ